MTLARRPTIAEALSGAAPKPAKPPAGFAAWQEPPPSVVRIVDSVLEARNEAQRYFRPSMIGGCPRQNIFFYLGAPSEPQQVGVFLHRILDAGTAIHGVAQGYMAAHPDYFFAAEVKVYHDDLEIRGSSDGVFVHRDTGYRFGLELKSIGSKHFKEEGDRGPLPYPEHVVQASIYARLMGVWWITILYLNKDTQFLKEFPVHYDPKVWTHVEETVRGYQAHVKKKTLPVFEQAVCKESIDFCQYRAHCAKSGGSPPVKLRRK